MNHRPIQVRVGVPLPGGRLVAAARERAYPVLFSANAFASSYPRGHEREGFFRTFRLPDPVQYAGLDAALDSAGFVAAVRYGDYRWTVSDYYDLVAAHTWVWHAAMDYCCEPQIANDRPLRILRIAATARMLAECRSEARRRGLPMPMPVLQGWTVDEYLTCADWLPLTEWPELVGIGSVCRRNVDGPDGLLAILDVLDRALPAHVRFHLFGVKSVALARLSGHPRVASIDSMAWDVQARAERRTGRDMDFRIAHMQAWTERQMQTAGRTTAPVCIQTSLFDAAEFGSFDSDETLVLEALARQYAELLMTGDIDYLDAVWQARKDGATLIAVLRRTGIDALTNDDCDDIVAGLSYQIAQLRA